MDSAVRLLQHHLASAQAEAKAAEDNWAASMGAKNAEVALMASVAAETKRHLASAEGKLASLQANTDVVTKTRDVTEARMIQVRYLSCGGAGDGGLNPSLGVRPCGRSWPLPRGGWRQNWGPTWPHGRP